MTEDHDATLPVRGRKGDVSSVFTPKAPPPETLGRFRLESLLGEGGMGQVWEAWDPQLERRVAVKRLPISDPMARRRFVREARLQASIHHPGICPVFEVGEAEGIPYIVMPRLEGHRFDEAVDDMALEQRLVLVRQVAEAVHAAHRAGLIHRDLKPSNILIESSEEGPPRPVVLDFGIARSLAGEGPACEGPAGEGPACEGPAGEGLTLSGEVVGTPSYMAPEQVEGELARLDRRTDVYGLGATLYRLLAGRPPHLGKGATLMLQILRDEPPRLRPLGIPAEIEAIVFKCLEKDKERRYDSALALAEDLGRYLAGEPVRARRIDWRIRSLKWLGRHRATVRVAAVAAVLLLAALGWGAWSAWQAEERQRLARHFGAQIEEVEALVRYSNLAPLHDVRPDRVALRRLLDSIRATADGAPPAVRALAHHALGRGHLALDELEAAQRHLELAWELGDQTPEVAADLGRALSERYRDRLTSLERVGDRAGRDSLREQLGERLQRRLDTTFGDLDEQRKQLERTLGDPARDLLVRARSPGAPEQRQLEALILFHQGRPAEALSLLAEARADPSWIYEPRRLEGDIRRSWAVTLHGEDRGEEARQQLELARRAYAKASAVAESDAAILRDDAQAVYLLARLALVEPDEALPLLDEGLESLDRARIIHPDDVRTWIDSARLHRLAAELASEQGRDPSPRIDAAIAAARQAIELDEASSEAWYELGRVHWRRGRWARSGEPRSDFDDLADFELAGEAFERVAPGRRDYAYFTSLGLLRMAVAGRRADAGLDATAEYQAAIAAYRSAAERHSAPFAALANLGVSLFNASRLDGTRPEDMLRRAVETFEQARALDAEHWVPHYYLGLCHLRLAQGGEPANERLDRAAAERAVTALERAAELASDQAPPQIGLGEVFHFRALDAHSRGAVPAPFFERARQAHARALELAPDHPVALLNLAWTAYFEGKFTLRGGGDPTTVLAEAATLCKRSLDARHRPNALLCLASVHRLEAEHGIASGEAGEAAPRIAEARRLFEEVLALDPDHAEAHRSLGRLFTLEARSLRLRGRDPLPALERARRSLDRALELERGVAAFWLADARWHLERAEGLVASGEDGTPAIAAGHQSLERAAELAPGTVEIARLEERLAQLNRAR